MLRIFILFLVFPVLSPASLADELIPIGRFLKIRGTPLIYRLAVDEPSKNQPNRVYFNNRYWQKITVAGKAELFLHDVVVTDSHSKAIIVLKDQTKMIVGKNSKIQVTSDLIKNSKRSIVETFEGMLRVLIDKSRTQRPPLYRSRSIMLGVRGTDFSIFYKNQQAKIATVKGSVEVSNALIPNQQPAVIESGQYTTVRVPTVDEEQSIKEQVKQNQMTELQQFLPQQPQKLSTQDLNSIKDISAEISEESEEEQQNLKQLEAEITPAISDQRYYLSVVASILPGFGVGHAVQERWLEKGWFFTAVDLAIPIFGGQIMEKEQQKTSKKIADGESVPERGKRPEDRIGIGIVSLMLGVRIWEVYDVINFNRMSSALSYNIFLLPQQEMIYFNLSYRF